MITVTNFEAWGRKYPAKWLGRVSWRLRSLRNIRNVINLIYTPQTESECDGELVYSAYGVKRTNDAGVEADMYQPLFPTVTILPTYVGPALYTYHATISGTAMEGFISMQESELSMSSCKREARTFILKCTYMRIVFTPPLYSTDMRTDVHTGDNIYPVMYEVPSIII